ncbi:hypothetical protein Ancab_002333 [Ancistrocladus abbreviatus]
MDCELFCKASLLFTVCCHRRWRSGTGSMDTSCTSPKSVGALEWSTTTNQIQVIEEGSKVEGSEVLHSYIDWLSEPSDSRSYVEEPLPSTSTLEKKRHGGSGSQHGSQRVGFSRGIFEIGDGYINEGINGEKDNDFYALIAPDSISTIEKMRERIGLTQMGQGSGNIGIKQVMLVAQTSAEKIGQVGREDEVGFMADVLKAQQEMAVVNTEDCSRSLRSLRTRQRLNQSWGALVEFQPVKDNLEDSKEENHD